MNTLSKILGPVALALVTACSSTPEIQDKPSSEFAGLNKVTGSGFSEAWARPDAALASYRVISASELNSADAQIVQPGQSLNSRISRDWEMTPERQQALAQAWATALDNAAREQGLATDGSGDKVLRIDAAITRIAPSANFAEEQKAAGRSSVYTEDSGEASAEFRLYDQASGELLAVIRDKRRVGSQAWSRSSTVSASADVRNLLSSWATRLVARSRGN